MTFHDAALRRPGARNPVRASGPVALRAPGHPKPIAPGETTAEGEAILAAIESLRAEVTFLRRALEFLVRVGGLERPGASAASGSGSGGESGDLLYGVPAIADFLGIGRRQARHRCDTGQIPTFRIGESICARKSTLTAWLSEQEAAARAAAVQDDEGEGR